MVSQENATLAKMVDDAICCAEVSNWDSLESFEEEIIDTIDDGEMTQEQHEYCSERIAAYWADNDGDDQDDVSDDE